MDDSLTEGGACDIFLLDFIDECQSVIAETLRLSDFLPHDLLEPGKSKFKPILLDFMYFSRIEYYEKELTKHEALQTEFYTKHSDVLSRFEMLFQAVGNLLSGFIEYSKQVISEHQKTSLDFTRELEVEALAKVGMLVYYFNRLLDGSTRERLYVAIYRNSDERRNIDFIVDFLRQEISAFENLVLGEYMYNRVRIDPTFVNNCLYFFEAVVRRKKENDLKRLRNILQPSLFCCLLFSHKLRYNDHARMKFYVENYFKENWVFPLGVGINVSIGEEWFDCTAASNALYRHFTNEKIKELCKEHFAVISDLSVFTKDIKPEKFEAYIECIQRYNISYQWMVLHSDKSIERLGRDYTEQISMATKFQEKALDVVLRLACFETEVGKIYSQYIRQKQQNLGTIREELCRIINEIAELFNSGIQVIKVEKREKLHHWLLLIKDTLSNLNLDDSENSLLVQQIRRRFIQVGEMLDLGENLAMAHFIEKVKKNLEALSVGLATTEDGEKRLSKAADAPYIWSLIDKWLSKIQDKILKSTRSELVQVLFLKLALSIDSVTKTLHGEYRKDLIGRAYSCYLERRLRNVLQSIPHHLFEVLHENVVPHVQQEWAPSIEKETVRDLADFNENFSLSEVTYNISNMSIGISKLSIRKLGKIDINPKELLEEGIRRELRVEIPKLVLVSEKEQKDKNSNLEIIVSNLTATIRNFKRAFIYMCDHVGMNGYELWREELASFMESFDLASTTPTQKKGPISAFTLIYNHLMKSSDPGQTVYSENDMVWRDRKGVDCLSVKYTNMIEDWIPIHATQLFVQRMSKESEDLLSCFAKKARLIASTVGGFQPHTPIIESKNFENIVKLLVSESSLVHEISKIGQFTLLQSILLQSKKEHGRLRATQLFRALEASNRHLLANVSDLPAEVKNVSSLSKVIGMTCPKLLLYASPSFPPRMGIFILSILLAHSNRINNGRKDSLCEASFSMGCYVILHHTDEIDTFNNTASDLATYMTTSKRIPFKLNITKEKLESFISYIYLSSQN
ncbi:unnamed protein product [Auanema sp. JU1783]|nr:unnamed protein product [Auanema sp. JU1783]